LPFFFLCLFFAVHLCDLQNAPLCLRATMHLLLLLRLVAFGQNFIRFFTCKRPAAGAPPALAWDCKQDAGV
jgi:hypothetical protein